MMTLNSNISVSIPVDRFKKLLAYAKFCDIECGGLIIGETSDKSVEIKDIILLKQKASVGDFKLNDQAIHEFMVKNSESQVVGWWHSHNKMKAYLSPVDIKTSSDLAQVGYCLAIVVNSRGDYKASLFHKTANFDLILQHEIDLDVVFNNDLEKEIKEDISNKIERPFFQMPGFFHGGYFHEFSPPDGYS